MKSYIIKENRDTYQYEFFDSYYSFAEDIQETIEWYTSKNHIQSDDIGDLLFSIHCHVDLLRRESKYEPLLEEYGLAGYGNGPQYDDNAFFILDCDLIIKEVNADNITLVSSDNDAAFIVDKSEIDDFLDSTTEYEKGDRVSFSGRIFVNKRKRKALIGFLHGEVEKLNALFEKINLTDRIISLTKLKQV